jgi:hypothetical protein
MMDFSKEEELPQIEMQKVPAVANVGQSDVFTHMSPDSSGNSENLIPLSSVNSPNRRGRTFCGGQS